MLTELTADCGAQRFAMDALNEHVDKSAPPLAEQTVDDASGIRRSDEYGRRNHKLHLMHVVEAAKAIANEPSCPKHVPSFPLLYLDAN